MPDKYIVVGEAMFIQKKWSHSLFDRYTLCNLIAIEILMSFTFLGYIHIPPISVTIAYLPILVAGCLLGPSQAFLVGLVFGLASMYKASASYVMPADAAFSPFLSGSPAGSILLSVGTRALFGLLIGMAFWLAKKSRHYWLFSGIIAAVSPKFHSLLVYSAMGILFPALGKDFHSAFHWKPNDTIFLLICVFTVEILLKVYESAPIQRIRNSIEQSVNNPYDTPKMKLFIFVFELFLTCMSVIAAVYFSQREFYMLGQHGVTVTRALSSDLFLLQIQFLIALFALNVITIILLLSTYKYMAYKEYSMGIDALTGVMGRRMFFSHYEQLQKKTAAGKESTGWFLLVDVDFFKAVNDTLGHATGDRVLQEIALHLQESFKESGAVGRIGGDEFAVIAGNSLSGHDLQLLLDQFLMEISEILPDRTVSCSIGARQFAFPEQIQCLLEKTDQALYRAKENGRACYVLQPLDK